MSSTWTVQLTCPACGTTNLKPLTWSREGGQNMAAAISCEDCGTESILYVTIAPRAGCGTNQGYQAHAYKSEPPCDECRAAHARYEADRRAKRKLVMV
jgi:predicted RNA-binding Zn-ribbon protein involved in translation (DUF1610 family)